MQIVAPPEGGQGNGKQGGQSKLGIQDGGHITADTDKKGPTQGNESDEMGQKVETQGQEGVDSDDGNDPLPIDIGNHQRQDQKPDD